MRRRRERSTRQGEHRPVLLAEVLAALAPQPGEVAVDCTTGFAGHASELLRAVGPAGRVVALDLDSENLPKARERLEAVGYPFALHHSNFAALPSILAAEQLEGVDMILADLGMSSMQVDDAERGFSYARDGPLDMRMDRSRGRTAAQLLTSIDANDLREALEAYGDEPDAAGVAEAIVSACTAGEVQRTSDLAKLLLRLDQPDATDPHWRLHPRKNEWRTHPAARVFQALRILVNREMANLEQLLRVLPDCLRPGGRAAIITFHSGEDRRVKAAFKSGLQAGAYTRIADDPVRASFEERNANPRSRSAKLRWAVRA
jgi:16S rRNA (cytosine1402-N4)-methyltransferase